MGSVSVPFRTNILNFGNSCHSSRSQRKVKCEFLVFVVLSALIFALVVDSIKALECESHQFKCKDGSRCLAESWKCDGDVDCEDKSDEEECSPKKCSATEYRCPNNRCIPLRWVCDGDDDCGNRAEELGCENRTCKYGEFACHSKGQCIPDSWRCDERNDCADGSDELDCKDMVCSTEEFACKNGKCISKGWHCDQENDCGDNSDEIGCPNTTCSSNEFTCSNGKCIPDRFRCDGDVDCPDQSDEQNCKNEAHKNTTCGPRSWTCHNGDCIHINWRCDQSADCFDHSDELNCSRQCREDQWQCKFTQDCIPLSMRCNGDIECRDESDEQDCHLTSTTPSTKTAETVTPGHCALGMFRCNNTGKCIDEKSVCDKTNDCGDWSDEPIKLCDVDECKSDHSCSQVCIDDTLGYHCGCYSGFKLGGDKRLCVDIDECKEIEGTCSGHNCTNLKGHYKCDCFDGYELTEHRVCKPKGHEKASIIFLNRHDVRQLNLAELSSRHQHYSSLYDQLQSAIVFDYNLHENYMVWSDVSDEKLYIALLDKSKPSSIVGDKNKNYKVLIGHDLVTVDGIAVDWVHNLVYWTDTGKNTIEVASVLKTSYRTTLISTGLDEPRGLVLNVMESFMVWSDWGDEPKIERASQDGSNRRTLIDKDIVWPNGLAIDYVLRIIYWLDAKLHSVSSCDFDGQHRKLILKSPEYMSHPFGIDVFEDTMYWSDWNREEILKANKFKVEENSVGSVVSKINSVMDVKIVHSYKQPLSANRCTQNSCSHLCLPSGVNSYRCACPDNLVLSANNESCVAKPSTSTMTIVVPTKQTSSETTSKPTTSLPPTETSTSSSQSTTVLSTEKVEIRNNDSIGEALQSLNGDVPENDSHFVFIITIAVVILCVVILIVGFVAFRNYQRRNITSMNFDNPVYRKTTEEQFVLEKSEDNVNSFQPSMEPLTRPGTNDFV